MHQILLQGQHALETLFPGIGEALLQRGALRHNYGSQTLSFYGGACCLRSGSESLQGWYCLRLLLEHYLRQELVKDEHLCVMERTEAVDLLYRPETQEVYGVKACDQWTNKKLKGPPQTSLCEVGVVFGTWYPYPSSSFPTTSQA